MKNKLFLITIALLIFSTVNAQSKKEFKQYFEINKGIVNQAKYKFVPENFISVGEHTSWQEIPGTSNYFQIKGDSLFTNLHYTAKNRNGIIKYVGVFYNKEFIDGKKQLEVELSSTQVASDGIKFNVTIRNDGYITMSLVQLSPWVALSYKGIVKKFE